MTKFLDVALQSANAAGRIIHKQYGNAQIVKKKENGEEVTDADRTAETAIKKIILKQFPDHGFWGEETGRNKKEYTWIVDPIDGTTNFIRGIPFFAVSIALAKNEKSILGVVLNPVTNELFYAEKAGAYLNRNPIRVQPGKRLDVVAHEITFRSPDGFKKNRQWMHALIQNSMSLKSFGACALSACFVASNRIDASFDARVNTYDLAAGAHIASQAGAIVTQANGKPLDMRLEKTSFILASSKKIHSQIKKAFPR